MHFNQNFILNSILLSALLFLFSCTQPQVDNSRIREAIVSANQKFMENVKSGNSEGLASLYTEDGQLFPSNSDIVMGKQAIQDFWQGGFDMGIKSATLKTIEVEGMGNVAYEVGKYTLFADGNQMIDTGKYIVIWKKEAGQWKLHRDIWNTSMPVQK